MKTAARLVRNALPKLRIALGKVTQQEVLVGVPREAPDRKKVPGESSEMNNATLAYIHDNGSPAQNIRARPFMEPGIRNAKKQITETFKIAAKRVIVGKAEAIDRDFHKVGLTAQASIREVINSGPPPELAESTLAARRRRGHSSTKPLVETAQLRNSINYVVRYRKK